MKESSDSEPRRGAGESPGYKKNWTPRSIVFSSRFARARVSLNCKRALPCSGRRCVCANVPLVSAGAPRHGPALPAWRLTPGFFRVAHCLCFWRALGQSAPIRKKVDRVNRADYSRNASGHHGRGAREPTDRRFEARTQLTIAYHWRTSLELLPLLLGRSSTARRPRTRCGSSCAS